MKPSRTPSPQAVARVMCVYETKRFTLIIRGPSATNSRPRQLCGRASVYLDPGMGVATGSFFGKVQRVMEQVFSEVVIQLSRPEPLASSTHPTVSARATCYLKLVGA